MVPDREPPGHIVLLGMMGSGKSTVGPILGRLTGRRYVDNDADVHERADVAPEEIFAADGEASLHEAEAAALFDALGSAEPAVIAAAAWVVVDATCHAALARQPFLAYLRARPDTLLQRIGPGAGRRSDATDLAWLEERTRERDAIYRSLADITVDTDELDAEAVAGVLLRALPASLSER